MRVECEQCHQVGPANLSVAPTSSPSAGAAPPIVHRCGACGATTRYQPSPPIASGPTCPKCGATRPPHGHCAQCGLAVSRMEDFRPSGAPSAVGDEPLAPAWAACQAAWADPGGHERVAELALVHGEYPWLARQYRAVLAQRPDDAIARDRLARIGRMAEAAMRATALPPAPEARRPNRMKLLLIALVVVLGGGLYAAHVISTSQAVRGEGTRVPARGKAPAESPVSRPAG